MVLVGAGVYRESVVVSTKDVTVRGADRNRTVIDGEGLRPYGVVGIADGVRVAEPHRPQPHLLRRAHHRGP